MSSHISPSGSPRQVSPFTLNGTAVAPPSSPVAVPKASVFRYLVPPTITTPFITYTFTSTSTATSTSTTATATTATTTAANRPSQIQQSTPNPSSRTATASPSSHRVKRRRRYRENLHYNLLQRRHLAQESAIRDGARDGREAVKTRAMAENEGGHHKDSEGKGQGAFMQSYITEWSPGRDDSSINLNAGLDSATSATTGPVLVGPGIHPGNHFLNQQQQQQTGYNANQRSESGVSQRAHGVFCNFTYGLHAAISTPSEQLAAQKKALEQREIQLRLAMQHLFFEEARVRRERMLLDGQRKAFDLEKTAWRNAFRQHPLPSFPWNPAGPGTFPRPYYSEPVIQTQFAEGNGPLLPPRPFTGDGLYPTPPPIPPPWPLVKMKETFKLYDTCWNKLNATDGKICYPTLTGRPDGLLSSTYITHLPPDHDAKSAIDVSKVSESLAFIIKQNVWAFFLAAFDLTPRYKTNHRYNNYLCDPSTQPYQAPTLDLSKALQSNVKELKAHLHLKETRRWHQDKLGQRVGLPDEEAEMRKALWNAIDELKKMCENAVVGGEQW